MAKGERDLTLCCKMTTQKTALRRLQRGEGSSEDFCSIQVRDAGPWARVVMTVEVMNRGGFCIYFKGKAYRIC